MPNKSAFTLVHLSRVYHPKQLKEKRYVWLCEEVDVLNFVAFKSAAFILHCYNVLLDITPTEIIDSTIDTVVPCCCITLMLVSFYIFQETVISSYSGFY